MMKSIFMMLSICGAIYAEEKGIDPQRAANTVAISDAAVKNLRIETREAEETEFEESVFSLGHIQAIPSSRSAVSSRVAGRILELKVSLGDQVEAGQELAKLEARVAGNPPPILTLIASRKGLVSKLSAAEGDPLEPEASLMEITDLSSVYAVADVPEHVAGGLKPGTLAHIRVSAFPNESFDGELLKFGVEADSQSGTLEAFFKLPNPSLSLRPGMRAEFSIVISKSQGVWSVPRSALQGDAANRFLFVKDFELPNAFVKVPVEVGRVNDRFVEVKSGLFPGDEVVVQGAYSLAFAGGGSVSLKELLDAAHGHEHNDDGSEMTAEQKAQKELAARGVQSHSHPDDGGNLLWKIGCGVLGLIVILQAWLNRGRGTETQVATSNQKSDAH
jgi:multidrug efflux pump subunit AcrA (membrane-fusion protein)